MNSFTHQRYNSRPNLCKHIATLLPSWLREMDGVFVCGGFMRSWYFHSLAPGTFNDIDIWTNLVQTRNEIEVKLKNKDGYFVSHESDNAISLSTSSAGSVPIQLIKYPKQSVIHVLEEFDLDVCMIGTDFHTIWIKESLNRTIKYHPYTMKIVNNGGLRTLIRVMKHMRYGFSMRSKDIIHMYDSCILEFLTRKMSGTLYEIFPGNY